MCNCNCGAQKPALRYELLNSNLPDSRLTRRDHDALEENAYSRAFRKYLLDHKIGDQEMDGHIHNFLVKHSEFSRQELEGILVKAKMNSSEFALGLKVVMGL